MKRKTANLAALLLAPMMLLAACSAPDAAPEAMMNKGSVNAAPSPASNDAGYDGYGDEFHLTSLTTEIGREPAGTENRKIIWDASMDIEADDAAALHGRLAARAAGLGGYEHTNDIRHYETYSVVSATFKVPPHQVQAFMAYAGDEGKVINSRLGSDDITENYYDSKQRLETKRATLAPYYRLLAEAGDLDEIIRIQRIIDSITEDIEALEGRLRRWDVLTEMATVSVFIRQENDPVTIRREINWSALTADDMGYLIKSGFIAVSSGAMTVIQWLAIAVLVTAPLWIVAAPIVWVVLRRRKKRRAAMPPPIEEEERDSTE